MEHNEPMREFVARFNRLVTHLSSTLNPPKILMSCFINALPLEIAFFLKTIKETKLIDAQNLTKFPTQVLYNLCHYGGSFTSHLQWFD